MRAVQRIDVPAGKQFKINPKAPHWCLALADGVDQMVGRAYGGQQGMLWHVYCGNGMITWMYGLTVVYVEE